MGVSDHYAMLLGKLCDALETHLYDQVEFLEAATDIAMEARRLLHRPRMENLDE